MLRVSKLYILWNFVGSLFHMNQNLQSTWMFVPDREDFYDDNTENTFLMSNHIRYHTANARNTKQDTLTQFLLQLIIRNSGKFSS